MQTFPASTLPIIILGAGPAGLTAGHQLAKAGKKVLILEASNKVGGLSSSFQLWGQTVDLGPHRFFSKDDKINQLWMEASREAYDTVPRQTRIFYKNRFFQYPLEAWNALTNLGLWNSICCLASYVKIKFFPLPSKDNFESWVTNRFGARLYNTFFKTYSEKLWGIPCTELHSDFASQRIKKLSLGEAIKNALFGNQKKHQSLVDEFLYPKGGTGKIYENLADSIKNYGGNVQLNCPATGFLQSGDCITAVQTPLGNFECSDLISSIPLTLLATQLHNTTDVQAACAGLSYRNTVLVYLQCLAEKNPFTDNWIYVHSSELRVGRITNFNNWGNSLNPERRPETILCLEYWTNQNEEDWNTWDDQKWGRLAIEEIEKTGLIPKGSIQATYTLKIGKSYPVYRTDYKTHVQVLINHLSQIKNLQAIGRYGAFKYNNQDHSILMGILAAENLLGKSHNLWDVNTDYEVYQESK